MDPSIFKVIQMLTNMLCILGKQDNKNSGIFRNWSVGACILISSLVQNFKNIFSNLFRFLFFSIEGLPHRELG